MSAIYQPISEEKIQVIKNLSSSGMASKTIAEMVGVSIPSVYKYRNEKGFNSKYVSWRTRKLTPRSKYYPLLADAEKLVREGYLDSQIREILGIASPAATKAMYNVIGLNPRRNDEHIKDFFDKIQFSC